MSTSSLSPAPSSPVAGRQVPTLTNPFCLRPEETSTPYDTTLYLLRAMDWSEDWDLWNHYTTFAVANAGRSAAAALLSSSHDVHLFVNLLLGSIGRALWDAGIPVSERFLVLWAVERLPPVLKALVHTTLSEGDPAVASGPSNDGLLYFEGLKWCLCGWGSVMMWESRVWESYLDSGDVATGPSDARACVEMWASQGIPALRELKEAWVAKMKWLAGSEDVVMSGC